MIRRTIVIDSPAYLHTKNEQLVVTNDEEGDKTVPLEDTGFLIIDNERARISKNAMAKLQKYNCGLIITDEKHMPSGLMLPLVSNTIQAERYRAQIDVTTPVKKSIWKQTIQAKIRNQALEGWIRVMKYGAV